MSDNSANIRRAVKNLGYFTGDVGEHQFMSLLLDAAGGGNSIDPSNVFDTIGNSLDPETGLEKIINLLIGLTDGGTYVNEFIQVTSDYISGLGPTDDNTIANKIKGKGENKLFTVTCPKTNEDSGYEFCGDLKINDILGSEKYNKNFGAPTKSSPNISVIQFHDIALNFSNRSSGVAGIFLNLMPTIELSKCQPYVDIKLITQASPIDVIDGKSIVGDGTSLLRFLNGKSTIHEDDIYSRSESVGIVNSSVSDSANKPVTIAGMELFTSPQTLVNGNEPHYDLGPDSEFPENRNTSIIDKFRPFMTFKSFDIDIAPARGMISTKSANMSFTLHDRSRLAEIGHLVKPDGLSSTEILVEYGWSHPEGSDSNNDFATILNSLRTKDKFQVINSSLTFNDAGEVDISLKLVSKGNHDLSFRMVTDSEVSQAFDDVSELFKKVSELKKILRKDLIQNEEVIGDQIMGKANSVSSVMSLDAEEMSELKKVLGDILRNPGSSDIYKDLATKMKKAITNAKSLEVKIQKAIAEKIKNITSGPDGFVKACSAVGISIDEKTGQAKTSWGPNQAAFNQSSSALDSAFEEAYFELDNQQGLFFKLTREEKIEERLKLQQELDAAKSSSRGKYLGSGSKIHISFAKLALEFIAKPLAASGQFEEVQLIFYPMNAYSTFAKDDDVGSFPISLTEFKKQFLERLKRNPSMTIAAFIGFMNSAFFNNIASDIYGFGSIYERDPETGRTKLRKKYEENKAKKVEISSEKASVFEKAYGTNSEHKFIKPSIQMFIETVPGKDQTSGGNESSIIRIHFFDQAATSFRGFSDLWETMRGDITSALNISAITAFTAKSNDGKEESQRNTTSGHSQNFKKQLSLLTKLDLLEIVQNSNATSDMSQLAAIFDDTSGKETDPEMINKANAQMNNSYVRIKGGPAKLRYLFHRNMPSIKYGSAASTVKKASLQTQQDNRMATIHMHRARKKGVAPEASVDDGMPLRTYPGQLSLETFGCPLINFGQQYFIDFGTGTTLDDIYGVTGVSHKFAPGDFTTSIKLVPLQRFGTFQPLLSNLTKISKEIESLKPN